MTPFAASSTVVNLLLATGPFSYPYSYVNLGPFLSCIIIGITCILAYVTATYMVEAISVAESRLERKRSGSVFPNTQDESNQILDKDVKDSQYYIRTKFELGTLAESLANRAIKNTMMVILCIYMYGAMSLKYVSGAQSLFQGIAFLSAEVEVDGEMRHSPYKWDDVGWVYYVSIGIFGGLSILFSFGDIENSKTLQIVTAISRVTMVILFYIGSFYYAVNGEGLKLMFLTGKNK